MVASCRRMNLASYIARGVAGGAPAASDIGKTMQSLLEILVITNKSGKAKKTGNDYSINEAHCVLRDESGNAGAVGVLVIPKALEPVAKVGLFSASFALEAATYGEEQGRIVARITGLTPVAPASVRRSPQPA